LQLIEQLVREYLDLHSNDCVRRGRRQRRPRLRDELREPLASLLDAARRVVQPLSEPLKLSLGLLIAQLGEPMLDLVQRVALPIEGVWPPLPGPGTPGTAPGEGAAVPPPAAAPSAAPPG
jgi:hypothetical protein